MNVETSELLLARIRRSIEPDGKVLYHTRSWMLTGPKGIQIKPQAFAAFFPGREGEGEFYLLPVMPGTDIKPFAEMLPSLQIPLKMRNELGANYPSVKKAQEGVLSQRGLPSIVLEFGKEAILLHYVEGMTLQAALTKIQQGVRQLKI